MSSVEQAVQAPPTGPAALRQFLSVLWPDSLGDGWLLFWGRQSKRSEWVRVVTDEILSMLEDWGAREDVYLGCGLRRQNLGPNSRGDRGDILAIPGVWADVDHIAGGEHKKPNLPPTEAGALALLNELGLPPSIVIRTGHGLQAWWKFREPWILDSDEERDRAERLTKGWCATLRAKAQDHGWDVDQVGDLSRIMRLPGLWNHKGAEKRSTELLQDTEDCAYNIDELESFITDVPAVRETSVNPKWVFDLNPLAEPPADKFAMMLEQDPLFRFSWTHARTDLQDRSASTYDLSLATRVLSVGWSAQEVVNLLIAHRRKYGETDKNSRRDYFERTLNRAMSGRAQDPRRHDIDALKATGSPPSPVVDSDPEQINGHAIEAPASTSRLFHLTDVRNAEHFAERHGDMSRYDHRRARWLLWRTHRWCPDQDAEIYRLAKESVQHRLKAVASMDDTDKKAKIVKWALQSESRTRLEAMIALARAERPISDSGDSWDLNPWLLCTPSGLVNLQTGQLRLGRPEDRLTMSTSVPFDAHATCPRWERFTHEIFQGNAELVDFLQQAIGYSLTGDTSEQCFFVCYGTGANGKSTLMSTLHHVLGDYASNMAFSTIELSQRASIPNDLAALVGRRLVSASETNDGTRLNESRIKALAGCDRVSARFLHHEFFEFVPVAKLWLAVNHKPIVRDDSHGFWRKLRLIPFLQSFPGDKLLSDTLVREGPGILAWAVRGCLAWQRAGTLRAPRIVSDATAAYAHESDPLNEFLEEACRLDPQYEVRAAAIFEHYTLWTDRQRLGVQDRMSKTLFGRKMGMRFESQKTRLGRVYKGVQTRGL